MCSRQIWYLFFIRSYACLQNSYWQDLPEQGRGFLKLGKSVKVLSDLNYIMERAGFAVLTAFMVQAIV